MQTEQPSLYRTLIRTIIFAAGTIIFLWLLQKIYGAILLLLFSLVFAIIINGPVARLEARGWKRGWASLVVFLAILVVLGLISWLVIPKIASQLQLLITNIPNYANQVSQKLASWLDSVPELSSYFQQKGNQTSSWMPSASQALLRIGNFSLGLLSTILLLIIIFSMVVYAVVNPKPLLEIYFSWFGPAKRDLAAKAFTETSSMLSGWFRSNFIGGVIEAIATVIVLSILGVPGAWVWGALALFAELVPKLGFYIMAVPPTLVALTISNTTALWVALFFIAMDEIMADFVMPQLRSNTMNIHPVSVLFMVLALGSAFGFIGILLATPLTAIIKAYYENFYANRLPADPQLESRIGAVLARHRKQKIKKEKLHSPG